MAPRILLTLITILQLAHSPSLNQLRNAKETIQHQSRATIQSETSSFRSGETLPELKLHYLTIGTPAKDNSGVTRNAVLIMHGTGGTGSQFLSAQFANILFGPGQILDATKYFIILPDAIGHGRSSKPS